MAARHYASLFVAVRSIRFTHTPKNARFLRLVFNDLDILKAFALLTSRRLCPVSWKLLEGLREVTEILVHTYLIFLRGSSIRREQAEASNMLERLLVSHVIVFKYVKAVSYTHLTLPTIYSV